MVMSPTVDGRWQWVWVIFFLMGVIGFTNSHLPHRVFAKVKVLGLLGLPRCDGLMRIASRPTRNCEATILLTSARFGSRASSSWLAKITS